MASGICATKAPLHAWRLVHHERGTTNFTCECGEAHAFRDDYRLVTCSKKCGRTHTRSEPAPIAPPQAPVARPVVIPLAGSDLRVFYTVSYTRCEMCDSPYVGARDVICEPCRKMLAQPKVEEFERRIVAA